EMLGEEVDERLVVDGALQHLLRRGRTPETGEIAVHLPGDRRTDVPVERTPRLRAPGDGGLAVRGALELADDRVFPEPPEHDVEAPVGQLLDVDDLAHRAGREDRRTAVVVAL